LVYCDICIIHWFTVTYALIKYTCSYPLITVWKNWYNFHNFNDYFMGNFCIISRLLIVPVIAKECKYSGIHVLYWYTCAQGCNIQCIHVLKVVYNVDEF